MGLEEAGHTITERRVNQHDKKPYIVHMTWRAQQNSAQSPQLAPSSSIERKKLQQLLKELARSLKYRKFVGTTAEPFVAVEEAAEKGSNYRIESVSPVDVTSPSPALDLRFFIGDKTYGILKVHLKPKEGPSELRDELIDDEESWASFEPSKVMEQIDDALIYSVENQCPTEIDWSIEEAT